MSDDYSRGKELGQIEAELKGVRESNADLKRSIDTLLQRLLTMQETMTSAPLLQQSFKELKSEVDRRFDQVEKRFDQVEENIEQLKNDFAERKGMSRLLSSTYEALPTIIGVGTLLAILLYAVINGHVPEMFKGN